MFSKLFLLVLFLVLLLGKTGYCGGVINAVFHVVLFVACAFSSVSKLLLSYMLSSFYAFPCCPSCYKLFLLRSVSLAASKLAARKQFFK